MGHARSKAQRGPQGGARHGPGASQTLRQAELPVRQRRGGARTDRAQLQASGQDQVLDAAGGGGGAGAGGDRAVQGGQGARRGGGQRWAGRTGGTPGALEEGELSKG